MRGNERRLIFRDDPERGRLPTNRNLAARRVLVNGSIISGVDHFRLRVLRLKVLSDRVWSITAAKKFAQYPRAKRFKDFRVMLDKMGKEVDAVVIGTPDHAHAVIAMEAMRRGKHVYCEKPLAHNIHKVRTLMGAARQYGVVTQLGNQGHSSDTIRRLCEWVWAGAVGPVHTVHAGCDAFKEVYCQLRNLDKLDKTYDVPKGLDYDLWIGPVPFRPYTPFWSHAGDWLQAIRAGGQAGSNFAYGGPLTQAALLGAVAIRFAGQTLQWDNQAARFTNHEGANACIHPAYRDGWTL